MARKQDELTKQEVTRRPVRSLWRNRDYMLLWGGQTISAIGSQLSQFAYPLLVLASTNSPLLMGIVSGLRLLPYLLLSLPAGAFVDRWNRRRLMILCDIGRALCLAGIPIAIALGRLTVVQICLTSVLEGIFYVFFNVAETTSLPHVVPEGQLTTAVSQNEATLNISYALGPFLGGLLFGVGRALPFLLDAISYAVSALSLFYMKSEFQEQRHVKARSLWLEIGEGLKWLWQHSLVRFMALLCSVGNFFDFGTVILVIIIASRQHASSFAIGMIYAIAGSAGVLGALAAGPLQKRFNFGQIMIGAQWIWALVFPLYVVVPNTLFLGLLTAVTFVLGSIISIVQYSYRLTLIPDELQGRVSSIFRLIAFAGPPLGSMVTGILLQSIDVVPTVMVFTTGLVLVAVATTLNGSLRLVQNSRSPGKTGLKEAE